MGEEAGALRKGPWPPPPISSTRTTMTEILDKVYDPLRIEEKWYEYWEEQGFFRAQADGAKPAYCIVIPPPNVTGVLHMGHALNNTLQDILVRVQAHAGL